MLFVNVDVSDDLVYNLIKVIYQNKEVLGVSFGVFNGVDFIKMVLVNVMLYYLGVLCYYVEVGVLMF